MRSTELTRKTNETDITLGLDLDGGTVKIMSGIGFLDHMLDLFAKHGGFGLVLTCEGDNEIDDHHSVEDIGIALGSAFAEILGDGRGIRRYGNFILPMDEALILVALDISGRAYLNYDVVIRQQKVGFFDTELVKELLLGLCRSLGLTLHVRLLSGENAHHIIEAVFKGLGRAMKEAVAIDAAHADEIPSTKGILI